MTDRVARRSLGVSTAVHAAMVVAALWGAGGILPDAPSEVPPPAAAPPAAQAQLAELVLAPEPAAAGAPSGDLPPLGDGGLPELPIATPGRTDAPGQRESAGRDGPAYSAQDLPAATALDDALTRELQGRRASPDLSAEQEQRRDAANFVEGRLQDAFEVATRRYETRITNRDLVLELHADAKGRVVRATLLRGTGVEELDDAIVRFFETRDVGLPPLPQGRPFWTRARLR